MIIKPNWYRLKSLFKLNFKHKQDQAENQKEFFKKKKSPCIIKSAQIVSVSINNFGY